MKRMVCFLLACIMFIGVAVPVAGAEGVAFAVIDNRTGGVYQTETIKNTGSLNLNIKFSPIGQSVTDMSIEVQTSTDIAVFPFSIAQSSYIFTGDTAALTLYCRQDAPQNIYAVQFLIRYKIGTEEYTSTVPIYVNIVRDDAVSSGGSTPKITISSYKTNLDPVVAGEEIMLEITMKNNGKAAANNLKAQLSSDGTFSAVSGSSSVFVDSIGAGQSVSRSIKLKVKADVAPGSYNVTVTFAYDVSGFKDSFSDTEVVAIPVLQVPKLKLAPLQIAPTEVFVGNEINITTTLNNTGKSKLYNVTANFTDASGIFSEQEKYIGTVEPGASANIDEYLSAFMEGEANIVLTITYENEQGDIFTHNESISVYVSEKEFVEPVPIPEPERAGFGWWWIIVLIALAGGGLAVFFLVRKRKSANTKKERDKAQIEQLERQFFSEQQARDAEIHAARQPSPQSAGNDMHTAEIDAAAAFVQARPENSGWRGEDTGFVDMKHEPLTDAPDEEHNI